MPGCSMISASRLMVLPEIFIWLLFSPSDLFSVNRVREFTVDFLQTAVILSMLDLVGWT